MIFTQETTHQCACPSHKWGIFHQNVPFVEIVFSVFTDQSYIFSYLFNDNILIRWIVIHNNQL